MSARILYRPGGSLLHRLHPLVKLGWLFYLTVFVFIAPSAWWVLALLALIVAAFPLNSLSLQGLRGARLLLTTAALLAVLQMLFNHQGETLLALGPLTITTGGLQTGVYVASRFMSVVLISYLFVLTTDPNDLAYALIQTGLPYRYGFALITAIRLVPVFENEAVIVYRAQLARGVQYDRKDLGRILVLARQFSLPLLVSALRKVDALAISMEGRCFGKYRRRTFLRQVHASRLDLAVLALLALACALTIGFL